MTIEAKAKELNQLVGIDRQRRDLAKLEKRAMDEAGIKVTNGFNQILQVVHNSELSGVVSVVDLPNDKNYGVRLIETNFTCDLGRVRSFTSMVLVIERDPEGAYVNPDNTIILARDPEDGILHFSIGDSRNPDNRYHMRDGKKLVCDSYRDEEQLREALTTLTMLANDLGLLSPSGFQNPIALKDVDALLMLPKLVKIPNGYNFNSEKLLETINTAVRKLLEITNYRPVSTDSPSGITYHPNEE